MRQIAAWMQAGLSGQRGHLFPWVPVALAGGIGLYFALPEEPPVWGLIGAALAGALVLVLSRRLGVGHAPLAVAAGLVAGCGNSTGERALSGGGIGAALGAGSAPHHADNGPEAMRQRGL